MQTAPAPPSQRTILIFWAPLAVQWLLMTLEGPFLAAVIARMGEPAFNLAAYGVAFAFAILVEAPVIMLMSAATALVEDAGSYRRLRNFANALNGGATALMLVLLVPPVFRFVTGTLLHLPAEVASLVYVALWLMLPWPAAIGYRRFLHGVLIRSGRTRLVAYGTLVRLGAMAAAAVGLYSFATVPGAWVGAAALSAGVIAEAAATRIMAQGAIRELNDAAASGNLRQQSDAAAATADAGSIALGYREIARFYYPLALTSMIALTTQPIMTFFMGRSPLPIESLAVFPVVHALTFIFRATAFSFQETVIALAGPRFLNIRALGRFGIALGLASSIALALVTLTPLADVWFVRVSALSPELAHLATVASRIAIPLPALTVLISFQQALLVKGRRTRPITLASAIEVTGIALIFALLGRATGWAGVFSAVTAFVLARAAACALLGPFTRMTVARARAAA